MEEKKAPTLDFDTILALDGDARAEALAAYGAEVAAYAAENAEEKYRGEIRAANYLSAKYKLSCDKSFTGFGERIEAIEAIIENSPALASLSDEERLKTAYYIDKGMHKEDEPSAEALFEKLKKNPEAMRLCEAAILEKLRNEKAPSISASSGSASMPITPQKKPKSIDEASALARAAFGI